MCNKLIKSSFCWVAGSTCSIMNFFNVHSISILFFALFGKFELTVEYTDEKCSLSSKTLTKAFQVNNEIGRWFIMFGYNKVQPTNFIKVGRWCQKCVMCPKIPFLYLHPSTFLILQNKY